MEDETTALAEFTGVSASPNMEEDERRLLQRLQAELEDVRRRKELAIGYDAYAFFCTKEKMLAKEILGLRIRRAVRRQMQAKLVVEKEEHGDGETLFLAQT